MSLVFYYAPMSSATPIHWVLEELGVPYEKVAVDLSAGDQKKPEFLALNPNGKVPVLVDDGTVLFESLAILIHLGETHGVDKGLWPAAGTVARKEALSWSTWAMVSLIGTTVRYVRNTSDRFPAETHNALQAEQCLTELQGMLGILDQHLSSRPFVLGETFSLVDAFAAGPVTFMQSVGVDIKDYAHIGTWLAKAMQRPSFAAVTGQ